MTRYEMAIYAEEPDLGVLLAETDRIVLHTVPTPYQLAHPESRTARIAAKKLARRGEEIASIDLARMNDPARRLLKARLVATGRYERAIETYPNLRGLDEVDYGPGSLDDFRERMPEQFVWWDRLWAPESQG